MDDNTNNGNNNNNNNNNNDDSKYDDHDDDRSEYSSMLLDGSSHHHHRHHQQQQQQQQQQCAHRSSLMQQQRQQQHLCYQQQHPYHPCHPTPSSSQGLAAGATGASQQQQGNSFAMQAGQAAQERWNELTRSSKLLQAAAVATSAAASNADNNNNNNNPLSLPIPLTWYDMDVEELLGVGGFAGVCLTKIPKLTKAIQRASPPTASTATATANTSLPSSVGATNRLYPDSNAANGSLSDDLSIGSFAYSEFSSSMKMMMLDGTAPPDLVESNPRRPQQPQQSTTQVPNAPLHQPPPPPYDEDGSCYYDDEDESSYYTEGDFIEDDNSKLSARPRSYRLNSSSRHRSNRSNSNSSHRNQRSHHQQQHQQSQHYYALKCLNQRTMSDLRTFVTGACDLVGEAHLLQRIPHHPNIIQLFGVSAGTIAQAFMEPVGYFLVLEVLETTLDALLDKWRMQQQQQQQQQIQEQSWSNRSLLSTFRRSNHGRNNMTSNANAISNNPNAAPTLPYRLSHIAIGIVRGMQHMHKHRVLFRDLKPQNCGLDRSTGTVKLFDFGLAREVQEEQHHQPHQRQHQQQQQYDDTVTPNTIMPPPKPKRRSSLTHIVRNTLRSSNSNSSKSPIPSSSDTTSPTSQQLPPLHYKGIAGSLKYMAPETMLQEFTSTASDVYSFAIVLWEIVTLHKLVPYDQYSKPKHFYKYVAQQNVRPPTKPIPKLEVLRSNSNSNNNNNARTADPLPTLSASSTHRSKNASSAVSSITLKQLIQSCWDPKWQNRPTFDTILNCLEQLLDQLTIDTQMMQCYDSFRSMDISPIPPPRSSSSSRILQQRQQQQQQRRRGSMDNSTSSVTQIPPPPPNLSSMRSLLASPVSAASNHSKQASFHGRSSMNNPSNNSITFFQWMPGSSTGSGLGSNSNHSKSAAAAMESDRMTTTIEGLEKTHSNSSMGAKKSSNHSRASRASRGSRPGSGSGMKRTSSAKSQPGRSRLNSADSALSGSAASGANASNSHQNHHRNKRGRLGRKSSGSRLGTILHLRRGTKSSILQQQQQMEEDEASAYMVSPLPAATTSEVIAINQGGISPLVFPDDGGMAKRNFRYDGTQNFEDGLTSWTSSSHSSPSPQEKPPAIKPSNCSLKDLVTPDLESMCLS